MISIPEYFIGFISNLIILNSILCYFTKNPITSLLFLVLNYILVAVILFSYGFIFLGIVFILIYVGAVSILLIFTLMLLNFKTIYYKNYNKIYTFAFIFIIYGIEFIIVHIIAHVYRAGSRKEKLTRLSSLNTSDNFFNSFHKENEILNISFELFSNNYKLLVILAIFLFAMLVCSVSIVVSKKNSIKQDLFIQVKEYNNNLLNV